MVHPFDGEAQKYFNSIYPQFSVEIKNACFKSCINKFNPIRSFVASYSCWPVIFTVYNLSPKMFMRLEFIFFYLRSCLVLRVQVGIQMSSGALTYDVSRKQNFLMKTALMWTINDFPAYEQFLVGTCMENQHVYTVWKITSNSH